MESYRRSGFVFYKIVHVSSETWIFLYFIARMSGIAESFIHVDILSIFNVLRRLSSALPVSEISEKVISACVLLEALNFTFIFDFVIYIFITFQ